MSPVSAVSTERRTKLLLVVIFYKQILQLYIFFTILAQYSILPSEFDRSKTKLTAINNNVFGMVGKVYLSRWIHARASVMKITRITFISPSRPHYLGIIVKCMHIHKYSWIFQLSGAQSYETNLIIGCVLCTGVTGVFSRVAIHSCFTN